MRLSLSWPEGGGGAPHAPGPTDTLIMDLAAVAGCDARVLAAAHERFAAARGRERRRPRHVRDTLT